MKWNIPKLVVYAYDIVVGYLLTTHLTVSDTCLDLVDRLPRVLPGARGYSHGSFSNRAALAVCPREAQKVWRQ